VHFASIGGKLKHEKIYPVFQVENEFPISEIVFILSKEPTGELTPKVNENLSEIRSVFEKRGIPTRDHLFIMENFWENVADLAVEILSTDENQPVVLNFSTGRRVLVSTMIMAGSFALGWQPKKKIICVQTSKNYPTAVVFEPIPPVIPDSKDHFILEEIKKNSRVKAQDIADELKKRQSTVSIRMKKLSEAGFISIKGHSKELMPKGTAILKALDRLVDQEILGQK